jgi:hypothetical protein
MRQEEFPWRYTTHGEVGEMDEDEDEDEDDDPFGGAGIQWLHTSVSPLPLSSVPSTRRNPFPLKVNARGPRSCSSYSARGGRTMALMIASYPSVACWYQPEARGGSGGAPTAGRGAAPGALPAAAAEVVVVDDGGVGMGTGGECEAAAPLPDPGEGPDEPFGGAGAPVGPAPFLAGTDWPVAVAGASARAAAPVVDPGALDGAAERPGGGRGGEASAGPGMLSWDCATPITPTSKNAT